MRDTDARITASLFDSQRLKVARALSGLSQRELAEAIAVSPSAVNQWESGKTRPRAGAVQTLAGVLGVPVSFFATSGRYLTNLDSDCTFFRSLRKTTRADRDRAMAHAILIGELARGIEHHARLPEMSIPHYPVEADAPNEVIDAIATEVRGQWNLGDDPVEDVVREIERRGAITARLALAEAVDAFSWPGNGHPIVILGRDKDDRARSRFDAAHELGHLVMHRDNPQPGDPSLERQAHRFASAFLIPPTRFVVEWPEGRLNWTKLLEIKTRWQMSLAALLYRARKDGLLPETAYESATKYMARAGWKMQEPGDLGAPERPLVLRRSVEALERVGIGIPDLAEQVRIPEELIRDYLNAHKAPDRITVEI